MQIAEYDDGRRKIVAHVGSAHTEAELGILLERAREMLAEASGWLSGLTCALAGSDRLGKARLSASPAALLPQFRVF